MQNELTNTLLSFARRIRARPPGHQRHRIPTCPWDLGLVFWPETARFPVEANSDAFALLERITTRRRLSQAPPEILARLQAGFPSNEHGLRHVLPEGSADGLSCPPLGLRFRTSTGETTALAPERWTSPESWLAWLEIAEGASAGHEVTGLARQPRPGPRRPVALGNHLDLPSSRTETVSTANTARFWARRRPTRPLGRRASPEAVSVGGSPIPDAPPVVTTRARPSAQDRTRHGDLSTQLPGGGGWPQTFAVAGELAGTNATPAGTPQSVPTRLRPHGSRGIHRIAALYYVGVMMVTLAWWRLADSPPVSEADPTLIPEAVMRLAEGVGRRPSLGVRSRDDLHPLFQCHGGTELPDAAARRVQAGPRMAAPGPTAGGGTRVWWEDGTDPLAQRARRFASVVGIYLRYVIKAGAKGQD